MVLLVHQDKSMVVASSNQHPKSLHQNTTASKASTMAATQAFVEMPLKLVVASEDDELILIIINNDSFKIQSLNLN